jgi:hypothetical protein
MKETIRVPVARKSTVLPMAKPFRCFLLKEAHALKQMSK